nr:3-keto-5-aminohexanoate cleavage protein [Bradyrhizobium yuanmingense]
MTPEHIATSALEAAEASATIAEIHVRDPATDRPLMTIELYSDATAGSILKSLDAGVAAADARAMLGLVCRNEAFATAYKGNGLRNYNGSTIV